MNSLRAIAVFAIATFVACPLIAQERKAPKDDAPPVAADSRLVVELFAGAPDIVQPIATDFDSKGRLLVVESHTHFRPAKYDGPKFDRVRMLEDTDGDGKADKFTTFFEGTTATMDLAVHFDGSVYLATRNEIIRLRDIDGDGKADEKTRIAFLETTGNYPHNGLSGITFDPKGNLYFGMGENLGVPYKLIAADGSKIEGGGEGGNYFWITADGKKLRRVATGFWNPFGSCRDIYGRLFVVDNDPDTCPPCRLLQAVEGGDYGFQFRYGRSGRHPFQAWNGELPGTLPMVAGTGESPCEVIPYESDDLPAEYLGDLLVPSWADHRVERYVPKIHGAGTTSLRKPFVQGGKNFYPSGLSVAPDGSLFVTDWGSKSYELHGKGAVWHVRSKDAKPRAAKNPQRGIDSPHRATRDAAARNLAATDEGRAKLREGLRHPSVRTRAACLDALIAVKDVKVDLDGIARSDAPVEYRAMAVRGMVESNLDVSEFLDAKHPAAIRVEAVAGANEKSVAAIVELFDSDDPYLRHAASRRFLELPQMLLQVNATKLKKPRERIGLLLAARAARVELRDFLVACLDDDDPDVRLIAAKWIADEQIGDHRAKIVSAMAKSNLTPREFIALSTTLARIDNQPVNEDALAGYFLARLNDKKAAPATRLLALRGIPSGYGKLKTETLVDLVSDDDAGIQLEALRVLTERADGNANSQLRRITQDTKKPSVLRNQALIAIANTNAGDSGLLLARAEDDVNMRADALRGLADRKHSDGQKNRLASIAQKYPEVSALVDRALGKPINVKRPPATDTSAWLKLLEGPADMDVGRRIFENGRVTSCAKCHRVDGRGANIGPDLSLIGRTEKKWIVESILQPSAVVAPHYQSWRIDTIDDRVLTGLLVHTIHDESHYVDSKGTRFKVEAKDVHEVSAARESIMPNDLFNTLTDQEIRDLVAYLQSRK